MTKLLSSGKEQVRLVKEIGGNARLLYEAKFEYLDINNPRIAPLMEESFVVFLIKDRDALNTLERLVRSKAMESAIDYSVITTTDLAMRIRAGMRDTPIMEKLVTYTDPMSSQVAFSTIKLIEANIEQTPPVEAIAETSPLPAPPAPFASLPIPSPEVPMANITDSIQALMSIEGALGACVVDSASGMVLGKSSGSSINLDIAAAGDTEVLRTKIKTIKALGLTDQIEDMLITLGNQIHILRPLKSRPVVFLFVVLDKSRSNLALARMKTADVDDALLL
jgi:hypothetical protein